MALGDVIRGWLSSNPGNTLAVGSDGLLYVPPPGAAMGVTDGSNAAAGQVGEYLTSSIGPQLLGAASGTAGNLAPGTFFSLTAGDWDVEANIVLLNNSPPNGALTQGAIYISTTQGEVPLGIQIAPSIQAAQFLPTSIMDGSRQTIGPVRFSSNAAMQVYANAQLTYSAGYQPYGSIFWRARRMR